MFLVIDGLNFGWFLRAPLAPGQRFQVDMLAYCQQQPSHGLRCQISPTDPLLRRQVFHQRAIIVTDLVRQIIPRHAPFRLTPMNRTDRSPYHCQRIAGHHRHREAEQRRLRLSQARQFTVKQIAPNVYAAIANPTGSAGGPPRRVDIPATPHILRTTKRG